MKKTDRHRLELAPLIEDALCSGDAGELYDYLAYHSGLPGPRANLELAEAFRQEVGARGVAGPEPLWGLSLAMTEVDEAETPAGDPREMIPFCGSLGLAMLAAEHPEWAPSAYRRLRQLARDGRWRVREAVAWGLQVLLGRRPRETLTELLVWIVSGDPLPARAVAAGLGDPPLLEGAALAERALGLHRLLIGYVEVEGSRRSEGFRTLRQALGYTLGVVVAAWPEEGWAFLEEVATLEDPDVRWIVRENLRKRRLSGRWGAEVARVRALLQEQVRGTTGVHP